MEIDYDIKTNLTINSSHDRKKGSVPTGARRTTAEQELGIGSYGPT
jgi:hypothetical protein